MNILQSLKFAQGAVSKKNFVAALTHFQIRDGRITGYNGKMSLSAPIDLDLDCCPKAETFVKAIAACEERVALSVASNGKLAIRSGKFRAHIECLPPELFPGQTPQGLHTVATGALLPALQTLYEFSADDASRPWAAGVLLDGKCFYATNNVIFAQYWTGNHFPYRVNIPRTTVKEILRIGEEPVALQVTAHSITFHYENERWLTSQLISEEWPDTIGLMNKMQPRSEAHYTFTEEFWAGAETLAPFVGELGRLYLDANGMHTETSDGMSVELEGLPMAVVNHEMLMKLRTTAECIDASAYPAPMTWHGGAACRGLLVGMAPG